MKNGKYVKICSDGTQLWKCSLCDAVFAKSVALGGHQSKAHPGTSSNYQRKLEIRAARASERQLLENAKDWFAKNLNLEPENNRKLITKIKNVLKAGKTPKVRDYIETAV